MQHTESFIPEKYRVVSGSALKLIAMITMVIDHIAVVLLRYNRIVLFRTATSAVTLYDVMRTVGRISFPLFAFLLTEGFIHTHDRKKYALRLFLFALISEIPWNLEHTGTLRYGTQNVFFTLLLGFLGLWTIEWFRSAETRRDQWEAALALFVLLAVSILLKADYGSTGFAFILMLYLLREAPLGRAALGCCMLSGGWKAGMAFIPIALYNGKRGFIRGRVAALFFYAFYPLHILILYWIKSRTIGY